MESEKVLDLLRESNALLEGHFLLSSGKRSDRYVQCAQILQHPARAGVLGVALGEKFQEDRIDVVVGPAMGGILIGHEVARYLGARCVFTERVDSDTAKNEMALRRGFQVGAGERVLVVEDVVTTGGSALEVVKLLGELGADVVGVGSIVNRSGVEGGHGVFPVPFRSLVAINANVWSADDDPLAKDGSVPIKPGSRALEAETEAS